MVICYMKVGLATPRLPQSLEESLEIAANMIASAASAGAAIVCFPESFMPGYPLAGKRDKTHKAIELEEALSVVRNLAGRHSIAVIMPMDWHTEQGLENVAFVISATGEVLGYQSKNQLDPSEDLLWTAGKGRQVFETDGLRFGIAICHEGFRYPETVRWAAREGAQLVFHPNCTGSNVAGSVPTEWGGRTSPYYEKATMMRALENTIFFASVNYCFLYPESASSIVAPDGSLISYQPYCEEGVLVADIDPVEATGLLARRFKPEALL